MREIREGGGSQFAQANTDPISAHGLQFSRNHVR
jgi:hypothetical protein